MEEKLKLLLIIPSALDSSGKPVKLKKLMLPSVTMLMLAAVTPASFRIQVIYETVEDIPFSEHWDLVGITGMGSGSVRAWQIADAFRGKGVKVVIGGIGPSISDPESTLEHADALVIGEADELWPVLLEDFRKGVMKRIYKAERPPDMATLPTPRFDLLNLKKMGFFRSIQATRGCPFTCSFCSIAAFSNGSYRKRPVDKVIEDIRAVKKSGSRYIVIVDDNLFFDLDYNRELWEALIPEKITWISSSTIHIADYPEMVNLAHRSGCCMLSIGIESLDNKNLKDVHKTWNQPDKYIKAIEVLRKNGIMVSSSMMMGLDHDTIHTFRQVFDFIMESHVPIPRIMIFTPIPGTPAFDSLEKENRIINRDFSKYTGGQVVFQPRHMTPRELQEGYWKLYTDLFTRKNIFRRMSRNIPGQNPLIIAGLFVTNFNYRRFIRNRVVPGIT
jgi:radical SAM superfamily enzyme YgiQ (UPF0313 family)